MAVGREPPIEWVAGTWLGVALRGAGALVAALLGIVVGAGLVESVPASWFSFSSNPFAPYLTWPLLAITTGIVVVKLTCPINLRIGLTPVTLTVKMPLRTVTYPRDRLYRPTWRTITVGPPSSWTSRRVVLTRRQASRVSSFWGTIPN